MKVATPYLTVSMCVCVREREGERGRERVRLPCWDTDADDAET